MIAMDLDLQLGTVEYSNLKYHVVLLGSCMIPNVHIWFAPKLLFPQWTHSKIALLFISIVFALSIFDIPVFIQFNN